MVFSVRRLTISIGERLLGLNEISATLQESCLIFGKTIKTKKLLNYLNGVKLIEVQLNMQFRKGHISENVQEMKKN